MKEAPWCNSASRRLSGVLRTITGIILQTDCHLVQQVLSCIVKKRVRHYSYSAGKQEHIAGPWNIVDLDSSENLK